MLLLKRFNLGFVDRLVGSPLNETERDARTVAAALIFALLLGTLLAIFWQISYWPGSLMWASASTMVGMLLGFLFGIPRFIARSGASTAASNDSKQAGTANNAQGGNAAQAATGDAAQAGAASPAGAGNGTQAGKAPQAGTRDAPQAANTPQTGAGDTPQGNSSPQTDGGDATQGGVNTNLEEISDWLTKIIVGVSLVEVRKAQAELKAVAGFVAQTLGGANPSTISFAYALLAYFSICGFLGSYLITRLYLQEAFRNAAKP